MKKMSDTLFGRNLLSQIASLFTSFMSLSIGQLEVVLPGQNGCIVLGTLSVPINRIDDDDDI